MRLIVEEVKNCIDCPFCKWVGDIGTHCSKLSKHQKWKAWFLETEAETIYPDCPLPKVEPEEN